jgi:hypothetical protein
MKLCAVLVLTLTSAGLLSCAARIASSGRALDQGSIQVYRDKDNTCRTSTTPFFAVKKSTMRKVKWEIADRSSCTASLDVEIRFDKAPTQGDPLAACVKKGKRKIECDIRSAPVGTYPYSVYLGTAKEDPELQIEM